MNRHDTPREEPAEHLRLAAYLNELEQVADANTLLLHGRRPALIDSGFVGHAEETAAWARAHAGDIDLVVNTHWHCDHVGGNALPPGAGRGHRRRDTGGRGHRPPGFGLLRGRIPP
jgi:glyoxylase-like metal-dependent hydrolase (beta-lactamase superfamily II)